MLITFKTITQQTFKIELDPSTLVIDIKKKICEEKGKEEFAVELQKLIFNGKILQDSQVLKELNIDEKKFIVVMVSKKTSDCAVSSSSNINVKESDGTSKDPLDKKANSSDTSLTKSSNNKNNTEHEEIIKAIECMGYPRDEVLRALKASFFDPDRAVEYLCNGIPETFDSQVNESQDNIIEEQESRGLEFLQNSPQFQQLRDLVQTQPHLLQQVVQQIANTNPELMNAIRNNQEEFLQLLNRTSSSVEIEQESDVNVSTNALDTEVTQNVVSITVSEEDRDAIQRLKALGFAEQLVIEAYFACDKNENLAVNYILTRMDEFHDEIGSSD